MEFDALFKIDHANLAVMAVDDGLGDGQAQAANFFSISLGNLQKSVEKKGDFVIGNRRTGYKTSMVTFCVAILAQISTSELTGANLQALDSRSAIARRSCF